MNLVIGIDPGSCSGALAMRLGDRAVVVCNMPPTPGQLWQFLYALSIPRDPVIVFVENVGGSMPGNSARSARTFATHRGHLEMALVVLGWPVHWVTPQRWQADLFGAALPKAPPKSTRQVKEEAKKARKQAIFQWAERTYPEVKVTHRNADALAILEWGRRFLASGVEEPE